MESQRHNSVGSREDHPDGSCFRCEWPISSSACRKQGLSAVCVSRGGAGTDPRHRVIAETMSDCGSPKKAAKRPVNVATASKTAGRK